MRVVEENNDMHMEEDPVRDGIVGSVSEPEAGYKGGFESLEAWKEARNFRRTIAVIVKKFPREERYSLADQLLRSSRSVCANIAEGYGRYHYLENIQACRIARGSLMESLDHLICARDENFIDDSQFYECRIQYDRVLKMLNGYILYLKKQRRIAD